MYQALGASAQGRRVDEISYPCLEKKPRFENASSLEKKPAPETGYDVERKPNPDIGSGPEKKTGFPVKGDEALPIPPRRDGSSGANRRSFQPKSSWKGANRPGELEAVATNRVLKRSPSPYLVHALYTYENGDHASLSFRQGDIHNPGIESNGQWLVGWSDQ